MVWTVWGSNPRPND